LTNAAQVLADYDELAANLWRLPKREHGTYLRILHRLLSLIT
jgi:hypothetical protein